MTKPPLRKTFFRQPSIIDISRQKQKFEDSILNTLQLWGYENIDNINTGDLNDFHRIVSRYQDFLKVNASGFDNFVAKFEHISFMKQVLNDFCGGFENYTIRFNNTVLLNEISTKFLKVPTDSVYEFRQLLSQKRSNSTKEFSKKIAKFFNDNSGSDLSRFIDLLNVTNPYNVHDDIKFYDNYNKTVDFGDELSNDLNYMTKFDPTYVADGVFDDGVIYEISDNKGFVVAEGRTVSGVSSLVIYTNRFGDSIDIKDFKNKYDVGIVFSEDVKSKYTYDLANKLRSEGISVSVDISKDAYDRQLKNAVKNGFRYVVSVNGASIKDGVYRVVGVGTSFDEKLGFERIVSIVKDYRNQNDFDEDAIFEI